MLDPKNILFFVYLRNYPGYIVIQGDTIQIVLDRPACGGVRSVTGKIVLLHQRNDCFASIRSCSGNSYGLLGSVEATSCRSATRTTSETAKPPQNSARERKAVGHAYRHRFSNVSTRFDHSYGMAESACGSSQRGSERKGTSHKRANYHTKRYSTVRVQDHQEVPSSYNILYGRLGHEWRPPIRRHRLIHSVQID